MKGSNEETRHAYKNLWRIETAFFIVFWSFHAPRDYIEPQIITCQPSIFCP